MLSIHGVMQGGGAKRGSSAIVEGSDGIPGAAADALAGGAKRPGSRAAQQLTLKAPSDRLALELLRVMHTTAPPSSRCNR